MLTTGCEQAPPSGQVLARVDGEEITGGELRVEAQARGLSIRDAATRNALLGELVDRKLLVREARRERLDRVPDYILNSRRSDEVLLAQQLLAARSPNRTVPDDVARQLVRDNPQMFDRRAIVTVDQLSYAVGPRPLPPPPRTKAELDGLERALRAAHVPLQRSQQRWDTAELSAAAGKLLASLTAGQPFALEDGGRVFVGQLLAVQPQPVPAADQLASARARLQAEADRKLLARLTDQARDGAEVSYQPGFEPGS
ncbi:hypothetical protein HMF7854_11855 [Sphingomonas ginkgonis]|uniref:Peptidyl-prolyl cis-trans isomerase, EpsD family n=1 Tax=Sphingomonas ginkgonis TaxID=2315330 RepID=A0A3R9YNE6_9SPHN|nr:hypothetical protein [Sphingomonas ginkgonis]RST31453.1 hypothetical protein HMF7854_11855 [Sphingomonas ginkgonis]